MANSMPASFSVPAVDVAQNPGLGRVREQRVEVAPEHLRAHVSQGYPPVNAMGNRRSLSNSDRHTSASIVSLGWRNLPGSWI